jgi:acetylcholinesterase
MTCCTLLCMLVAVSVTSALGSATDSSDSVVVDVGYAKYRGTRLAAGVDQYLGMRYADPPLGNLRFRAPRAPSLVDDVQSADKVTASN